MPVLDAKALEIDSKGMAFLMSVLHPRADASVAQPNEVPPPKSLPYNVRMYFRSTRRTKPLLTPLV